MDSCVIHCKYWLIVCCVVCNNLYSSSVLTYDSSAKTVAGVINTAFKHLKTSFLLSLKRVAATDVTSHESPALSSLLGPSSLHSLPTSVHFPSLDNFVTQKQDLPKPDTFATSNSSN